MNTLMSRKCGVQWGLGRLIAFYGKVMMFEVVFVWGRVLIKLRPLMMHGIFRILILFNETKTALNGPKYKKSRKLGLVRNMI